MTIVGGAGCGLFCLGIFSILGAPATVPVGAVLGAVLGIPVAVGVVLAARHRGPLLDPPGFQRALAITGLVLGLLASSPTLVYSLIFVGQARGASSHLWLLASAALAFGGVATVGWLSGTVAGRSHARRVQAPPGTLVR